MSQISVLGCGWLGFSLAKKLIQKGFKVNGSTTTLEKINSFQDEKIKAFQINLSEDKILGNVEIFLNNSEVLVVAIPPKVRDNPETNSFVNKIRPLISNIEKSSISTVIFISSISVYGNDTNVVTEETIPNPDSESGKQLVEAEKLFSNNSNFNTIIVRMGGLIGENRHPVNYLSGRRNISNPEAVVNLIHRNDAISIIENLILFQKGKKNLHVTLNAVTPMYPTRENYYTQKSIEFKIPPPEFEMDKVSIGKKVSSEKLITLLNYQFQEKI